MKKFILSFVICFGSLGLMAQSTFVGDGTVNSNNSPVTIQDLLNRVESIGNSLGDVNEYFSPWEQRMLNQHFSPNSEFAPVFLTHAPTQNIAMGAGIACALTGVAFRDNNLYQPFDLPGDFGITNGLEITAVEFAFDDVLTTTGFPVTVNIYEIDNASDFPGVWETMTLVGTAVYDATNADAFTIVNVPLAAQIAAGKSLVMELVLIDDGTESNYTRMGVTQDAFTGGSYIMAAACDANTPLPFSDLGLGDRTFIFNIIGDDEPGGSSASIAYGVDNAATMFLSFDPADTSDFTDIGLSPIGSSGNFENAGSIDPNDHSTAYVLSNDSLFYEVDVATGVYTLLGTITPDGAGASTWVGAEFNPVDGELYAIASDLSQTFLFKIDIDGLSATNIGMTNNPGSISLMINGDGAAYTHDLVEDAFYAVDLETGASTFIGPLPFDANYGQGGTWIKGDDDAVYLSAFNNGSFQAEWWRIDTFDGSGTMIGAFTRSGALMQIGWSSAPNDPTMGVSNQSVSGFSYYPNPVRETISLKADKNIQSVVFYNIIGQKVQSANVDAVSADFNLSKFQPGLYIMSVTIDGKTQNHKILKK
jgi:hypothetical protein